MESHKRNKVIEGMKTTDLLLSNEIHTLLEPLQDLGKCGWKRLEELTNLLQEGFVEQLRVDYPTLSERDIQVIMLIRSGLTHEEIARIGNVTLKSFRMRRYRIKRKMGVRCDSLTGFILALYRE